MTTPRPRPTKRIPSPKPRPSTPFGAALRPSKGRVPTRKTPSPDRLLDAALDEFAARGFAGARVDRIAAAARLNKAMLYYHFGSKARLYRTTLQRVLDRFAEHLEAVATGPLPPLDKLDAYVETFIRLGLTEPRFAPIMLREVAEGAARLDQETVQHMVRIVGTMATVVREGVRSGEFREMNPLLAYLTTAWPIMIYLASKPIRDVIHRHASLDTSGLEPESFVRHMQEASRRMLMPLDAGAGRRPDRSRTTEPAS
jgi:TetR/AcrR family transcriptional regulator